MVNVRLQEMFRRFESGGFEGMEDREVLETLLLFAMPSADCKDISEKLLETFGSIYAVTALPVNVMTDDLGLNESAAALLKSLPELIKRYSAEPSSIIGIEGGIELLRRTLCTECVEKLAACFYDDKNRCLACEIIDVGTETQTPVDPLRIFAAAERHGAKRILIAHNHPNHSEAEASASDISVTKRLAMLLDAVGMKLIDHIVVTSSGETLSICSQRNFPKSLHMAYPDNILRFFK